MAAFFARRRGAKFGCSLPFGSKPQVLDQSSFSVFRRKLRSDQRKFEEKIQLEPSDCFLRVMADPFVRTDKFSRDKNGRAGRLVNSNSKNCSTSKKTEGPFHEAVASLSQLGRMSYMEWESLVTRQYWLWVQWPWGHVTQLSSDRN